MATPSYEDKILTVTTSCESSKTSGLEIAPTTITVSPKLITPTDGTTTSSHHVSASSAAAPTSSPHTTRLLPTGAVAGIVVGSVVGLVSMLFCVLLAFGFRIRRNRTRAPPISSSDPPAETHCRDPGLEDTVYTRRLETLHNGPDPELGGGGIALSGLRHSSGSGSSRFVAELEGDCVHRERADSIQAEVCFSIIRG